MKTNIFASMNEYEAACDEYEASHDGNCRALYNTLDVVFDGHKVRTDCTIHGYKRVATAVKHFWAAVEAAGFVGGWCFADVQSCTADACKVGGYRDGYKQLSICQIDDTTYYIAYNYEIETLPDTGRSNATIDDSQPEQAAKPVEKSHRVDLTAEKVDALCKKYNWCEDLCAGEYRLVLENVDRDNKRGFGPGRLAQLARQIKFITETDLTAEDITKILRETGTGEKEQNLKTNSAKARLNIRTYIVEHADFENYDNSDLAFRGNPKAFVDVATWIYQIFCTEMPCANRPGATSEQRFTDWCSGLPSALDCCYWYNRSAVDDLGDILQQTPEKKAKYTEGQAEKELTRLICREIMKEVR